MVFNEELKNEAIVLVNKLRNSNELNGYIEIIYKGNIEKKIKKASKLNSKFIILSGVTIYSLLQCGHARSQIDAVSMSIDNGGSNFLFSSKF